MKREASDRETVAGVLVSLVHARLIRSGSSKTLRTGLHASVPVSERASVRRGLNALVDHGILAMSGEDIGFTYKGRLLLAYVKRAGHTAPVVDTRTEQRPREIDSILDAIDQDDRFEVQGHVEDVQSLPARLHPAIRSRRSVFPARWIGYACLLALVAAYALGH